mmetsp:Transcript_15937/g.34495  ORF Transcript_15937/g.34495 Transcript_15937/m.34495 type:complete len:130 (+) Transcript_15937:101-490(+)|eukprot:CAMPEP_0206478120 /NCGR_PEP_ID=MMETSP0324_2-20121206/35843_1 /ASSEMBLY_ACC=CAM_ASM_000836 /TAXON_ID=2866 /ORGANISM="Crypthecodinium cohnii, Strain Seligo" /LENGTH=129 /DNA_ID=CAMNT_0053954323 /DNA_START=34 /DNA_END=423 /DNA_ORIENTATION=-
MASVLSAWLNLSCYTSAHKEEDPVTPRRELSAEDLDLIIDAPRRPSLVSLDGDYVPCCKTVSGPRLDSDAFRSNTSTMAPSSCGETEESASRCRELEDFASSSTPMASCSLSLRQRRALPALKVQTKFR